MSESGQDYAEYALLFGFIAIVVIAAITLLGDSVATYFDTLVQAIESWG